MFSNYKITSKDKNNFALLVWGFNVIPAEEVESEGGMAR